MTTVRRVEGQTGWPEVPADTRRSVGSNDKDVAAVPARELLPRHVSGQGVLGRITGAYPVAGPEAFLPPEVRHAGELMAKVMLTWLNMKMYPSRRDDDSTPGGSTPVL